MIDPAVHEDVACRVEGHWPRDLEGTFLRIGPHPLPGSPLMRWGSYPGLLHAVHLSSGAAWFRSTRMGVADAPSANVIVDSEEVLGFGERGPVWQVDLESLEAAARPITGGRAVTVPHAEVDSAGRLVLVAFDWPEKVLTAWTWESGAWRLRRSIDVPGRNYVHHAQVIGEELVVGLHPLVRTPRGLGWDTRSTASTWVAARLDCEDPPVVWEAAPCFVWHSGLVVRDPREPRTLVLRAPVRPTPGLFPEEQVLDADVMPGVREWALDSESGRCRERQVTQTPCDFPVPFGDLLVVGVAGTFRGGPDYTRCAGVALVDADGVETCRRHPAGTFGGEFRPVVTNEGAVLMGLISGTEESQLLLLDPEDLAGEPIARVVIPASVPAGLHAAWVPG